MSVDQFTDLLNVICVIMSADQFVDLLNVSHVCWRVCRLAKCNSQLYYSMVYPVNSFQLKYYKYCICQAQYHFLLHDKNDNSSIRGSQVQ